MERIVRHEDRTEYHDGSRLHSMDSPAIQWDNGDEWWCQGGLFHREDGPAVSTVDEGRVWYMCGDLHRLDGPAIERPDGSKEWWVFGRECLEEFYDCEVEKFKNRLKPVANTKSKHRATTFTSRKLR